MDGKHKDFLRELGLDSKPHSFWNTQPVPQWLLDGGDGGSGPIEGPRPREQIRAAPYSLPEGFAWDTLDLDDAHVLAELFALLNENYVEDDDAMFRFAYQPEFLLWVLRPPGWRPQWLVGLRCSRGGRLVGFIAAVPLTLRLDQERVPMVEINFLCVHKKLRTKRMAPVLIREVTRRVNLEGIFQAVYTAGVLLPRPFSTSRYWHRPLNPKKLIDVGFSRLSSRMTLQRTQRLYRLPEAPRTPGFHELRRQDCDAAWALLERYLRTFQVAPSFSREDFEHWFLPRPGVVYSFVVEREGALSAMVSFFSLPSSVVRPHPTHKVLEAAYSFYNVSPDASSWSSLMTDALVAARNLGMDVFNALDLMDNSGFLKDLKFGQGNGHLHYYLYNWRSPMLPPCKVALVMQ